MRIKSGQFNLQLQRKDMKITEQPISPPSLVGASGLDVTRLLAFVADTLACGFRGAVARDMANFATVVALLTLSAIASHMTEATARIASLLAAAAVAIATVIASALMAVTSNVADLAALVAFLTAACAAACAAAVAVVRLSAFARDMAYTAAAIAGLFLRSCSAFTADVSLASAVVASGISLVWAVASLMRGIAAVEASTSAHLE